MAVYVRTRIVIGFLLIIIGVLFILNNYGIEIIPSDFLTWEFLFILFGLLLFILSKNKVAGIIFISIGLFNLFPELWPLIFVLLGILIIFRRKNYNEAKYWKDQLKHYLWESIPLEKDHYKFAKQSVNFTQFASKSKFQSEEKTDYKSRNEFIEEISIFGGSTKILHTNNFRGGSILSIFGGSEIDLSDCKLAEGNNILEITAIFGGSTLIVPPNWKIEIDVLPIFGGFSDKRIKNPNVSYEEGKTLIIKGFVLFGGGEIKNQ